MSAARCSRYGLPTESDVMEFRSVLESSAQSLSTSSTFYTSSIKLVESIL